MEYLKRYNRPLHFEEMEEDINGDWVKWEDVKKMEAIAAQKVTLICGSCGKSHDIDAACEPTFFYHHVGPTKQI